MLKNYLVGKSKELLQLQNIVKHVKLNIGEFDFVNNNYCLVNILKKMTKYKYLLQ